MLDLEEHTCICENVQRSKCWCYNFTIKPNHYTHTVITQCRLWYGGHWHTGVNGFVDYFICKLYKSSAVCVVVSPIPVHPMAQKWLWHPRWLSWCMIPNQAFILSRGDSIAWLSNPIFISSSDIPEYSVWMKHALPLFSSCVSVLICKAAATMLQKQDTFSTRIKSDEKPAALFQSNETSSWIMNFYKMQNRW